MAVRRVVRGRGFCSIWGVLLIAVVIVGGVAAGYLVLYPSYQRAQEAGRHYQAAVGFEDVKQWSKAVEEYEVVLRTQADYKDTRERLAAVYNSPRWLIVLKNSSPASSKRNGILMRLPRSVMLRLNTDCDRGSPCTAV